MRSVPVTAPAPASVPPPCSCSWILFTPDVLVVVYFLTQRQLIIKTDFNTSRLYFRIYIYIYMSICVCGVQSAEASWWQLEPIKYAKYLVMCLSKCVRMREWVSVSVSVGVSVWMKHGSDNVLCGLSFLFRTTTGPGWQKNKFIELTNSFMFIFPPKENKSEKKYPYPFSPLCLFRILFHVMALFFVAQIPPQIMWLATNPETLLLDFR